MEKTINLTDGQIVAKIQALLAGKHYKEAVRILHLSKKEIEKLAKLPLAE